MSLAKSGLELPENTLMLGMAALLLVSSAPSRSKYNGSLSCVCASTVCTRVRVLAYTNFEP